jgi:Planctomycete cytochrome C
MNSLAQLLTVIVGSGLALPGLAETPEESFATKLLPLLERDCQGCHGPAQALSNLDLSTREALMKGGVRGAALVPGKSEQSLLIHVLEGRNKLQMPPGGENQKLPAELIAAFRTWVDAGAPWPQKKVSAGWDYKPENLLAFRPLRAFDDKTRRRFHQCSPRGAQCRPRTQGRPKHPDPPRHQ